MLFLVLSSARFRFLFFYGRKFVFSLLHFEQPPEFPPPNLQRIIFFPIDISIQTHALTYIFLSRSSSLPFSPDVRLAQFVSSVVGVVFRFIGWRFLFDPGNYSRIN